MKKFMLLLCAGVMIASGVSAQDLKPFKVDLSVGYANPAGDGAKAGFLFAVEPKYHVIPAVAVGLRMEAAVVARGIAGGDDSFDEVEVKAAGSYVLTGDYYLTNRYSFRPFAGIGGGLYKLAGGTASEESESVIVESSSKFGGLVRAGFEAGHFRLGLEYNIVPDATLQNDEGSGPVIKSKNSYLGIKLGVCIGGGRK